jgi:hypothetical protein
LCARSQSRVAKSQHLCGIEVSWAHVSGGDADIGLPI